MCFILDSLQSRKTKIKVIRRANQVNLERLIRIITNCHKYLHYNQRHAL